MKQTGHTVLITGGATGIGFALAQKFHAVGNRVILIGRTEKTLTNAAIALPGVHTAIADISVSSDRDRLVANYPDTSILVNNAGIQNIGPFEEFSPSDIEREVKTDFLGPVLLCRAFLPILLKHQVSAIVNVSSGLALVPKQTAPIYCASKAALHVFSKTLRWQLESTAVKVFEVLPPMVDTPMTAGRGRRKITPDRLADEFWRDFERDRYEMRIGLTKVFGFMHRIVPGLIEKLVRPGQ